MNFDILHRSYTIKASRDERVPQPVPRGPSDGSILIWAPDEPIERLYLVLTAAALTGRHVRVIAKPGNLAMIPAEVIALENAPGALGRAAVCVVASLSDPSAAIALTDWKLPICATFTSGAQEWIAPVCTYRSWSYEGALAAITEALAMPSPEYSPSSAHHAGLAAEFTNDDALVTIIVRSKDGSLREATQRSVHAQTHHSHELIVACSAQAVRDALTAANGRYVLFLEDGDILFSDHLAALVEAMENSHAHLAYAGGLLGYVMDAPGPPTVLGYSVMEKGPVSRRSFLALDEFAGTYFRVLFRCESLRKVGLNTGLDGLAIFCAFSQMLAQNDAVHVDGVTGMSLRFLDGRIPGVAPRNGRAEYEAYYRVQPSLDADITRARTAVLAHLAMSPHIGLRPPPQRLSPPRPL